jgi:FKBP-type peptidyl-prolyl cis-trans isomerase 2
MVKSGDFVKISYAGWVEGQLIETTELAIAKKEGAYDEKRPYEPVVIVVGEGHVLPGIDKALQTMKVGDKKKFDIPAIDAFGERSFKLIKLVPLREFKKQNINPMPGMVFEVEGRPVKIQSVSGGRVRVDYNHPLAGKDVQYEVRVEADAKSETDKINFLLERAFKDKGVKFTSSGSGDKKIITVDVPDAVKANKLYRVMEMIFKNEVEKYLGIKDVKYKGEDKDSAKKPETKKPAAKKAKK